MPRLLIVHHTASPTLHSLFEAVMEGAGDPALAEVEVVGRAALAATAVDVMEADGYLLGTPANIGYISGALKHYFDTVYYPCLEATQGRPFAAYVHGNLDSAGAVRAIESITTGLQWRAVGPVLTLTGAPDRAARDAVYELAATLATESDNSRT